MTVELITYKGKPVIYADFRGITSLEQQIEHLDEMGRLIEVSISGISLLVNLTDVPVGLELMEEVKNRGKKRREKIIKQAMVGITGLKGILLDGYGRFTGVKVKAFASETDALEWLVVENSD